MSNSNHIVSIIFTHQARLRCLVHALMYGTPTMKGGDSEMGREAMFQRPTELLELDAELHDESLADNIDPSKQVHRFKNACMLRIEINSKTISINLMINGVVDEMKSDYVYYVKPGTEDEDVNAKMGRYKIVPFNPVEKPNTMYDVGDQTYIFYLVRHGQATHNVYKTAGKIFAQVSRKTDTHLTDSGREQAVESGKEARVLISSGNVAMMLPPTFLFASDLMRTRETLVDFLKGMGIPYSTDIIVLPCSHELDYKKDGNCDSKAGFLSSAENITSCSAEMTNCKTIDKYKVDWSAYDNFYKEVSGKAGMRSGVCATKNCNAYKCKNTDMLKEAINIIRLKSQRGGRKKKRRRKTAKRTTKRQNRKPRKFASTKRRRTRSSTSRLHR